MKKFVRFLAAVALGALAFGAVADPIGPDCGAGNCFGNIYALFFTNGDSTGIDNGDGTTTYDISLAINTTSYNNPGGPGTLYAAGFKVVSSSSDIIAADTFLLNAPGGTGAWTVFIGGVSNGCSSGSEGFLCAAGSVPVPDGTYQWDWQVTVNNGELFTTGDSVKASFNDATGKHDGNTSAPITLQTGGCPPTVCIPQQIPEPTTLALLGIALLGAGFVGTGRRKT